MKILFTLRPEIFSILIMIYLIIYDRYSARFRSGRDEFLPFALVTLGHDVMALVTEITVNLAVPSIVNRLCHVLFFAFALLFSLEYLRYCLRQILPDDKPRRIILMIGRGLSLIAIVIMLFSPIAYNPGICTNYSAGIGPTLCFMLGFIFLLAADVILIVCRKRISLSVYGCLLPVSFVALGLLVVQILIPQFLYTAQAVTITALGLFFVIENPIGKFKDKAFVDHNTQIWNRNGYEDDLEHMLPEKLKTTGRFIYLMADVNSLKAVNDTLGHLEGDRVIEESARILHEQLSSASKLYRVGGDEFVAFFFDTPMEAVAAQAKAAEDLCAKILLSKDVRSGLSIGYAAMEEGESVTELSRRAERMMYESKRTFYSSLGVDRRNNG